MPKRQYKTSDADGFVVIVWGNRKIGLLQRDDRIAGKRRLVTRQTGTRFDTRVQAHREGLKYIKGKAGANHRVIPVGDLEVDREK